jgi:transposase
MARVGRDEWAKRIQRWKDSGLTAREFASEVGLSAASLSFWKWRLKKDQAQSTKPTKRAKLARREAAQPIRFVEVRDAMRASVASSDARLELVVGSRYVVRVPNDFDETALRKVLDVVEHRS